VGHETDWTIIDLVADWRAPTPTAAAERAVPVRAELLVSVTSFGIRAMSNLRRALEARRSRFLAAARGLPRRAEILELPRQRLDYASGRLPRALLANARAHRSALERCAARLRPHIVARAATSGRERLIRLERSRERALAGMIERARRKLDGQAKLLSTLSYQNVLARGFTLVRGADGAMLRRASEVKPGAALDIEFADGHIGAHADPRARKPEASAKEPRKPADGKQGTLL
jgi:exodeoxyribonuclease VII large subunit